MCCEAFCRILLIDWGWVEVEVVVGGKDFFFQILPNKLHRVTTDCDREVDPQMNPLVVNTGRSEERSPVL
jgi:hypothetical protein